MREAHLARVTSSKLDLGGQYTQDYDERYMPFQYDSSLVSWPMLVQPYIKSSQLFICPSQPSSGNDAPVKYGSPANVVPSSYALNSVYNDTAGKDLAIFDKTNPMGISAVPDTSGTVAAMDTVGGSTALSDASATFAPNPAPYNGTGFPVSVTTPLRTSSAYNSQIIERHLETANALFLDGHVKALKISSPNIFGTATAYYGGNATRLKYFSANDD